MMIALTRNNVEVIDSCRIHSEIGNRTVRSGRNVAVPAFLSKVESKSGKKLVLIRLAYVSNQNPTP